MEPLGHQGFLLSISHPHSTEDLLSVQRGDTGGAALGETARGWERCPSWGGGSREEERPPEGSAVLSPAPQDILSPPPLAQGPGQREAPGCSDPREAPWRGEEGHALSSASAPPPHAWVDSPPVQVTVGHAARPPAPGHTPPAWKVVWVTAFASQVKRFDQPDGSRRRTDSAARLGFGGVTARPPRPAPARRPASSSPGRVVSAQPSRQPRAPRAAPAAPCPRAGSAAASCPGCPAARSPRRARPGRAPAPCPTDGPASCAARAPAPAPPTPRAARRPGPCAAPRAAARCPGTQATPSECPTPCDPARPSPSCDPVPGPLTPDPCGSSWGLCGAREQATLRE